jgi:hypothetical protein
LIVKWILKNCEFVVKYNFKMDLENIEILEKHLYSKLKIIEQDNEGDDAEIKVVIKKKNYFSAWYTHNTLLTVNLIIMCYKMYF